MRRTSRRWRRPTTGGARRRVPRRPRFCAARGGRARHLAARPGADALHRDRCGAGRDRARDDRQCRVEHRSATGARTGAHDRCVIGGYTLVDARAVEDVNGWAFFAMSSYLGATFAIIGNRLPIERLRPRSGQVFRRSCLVDELCAHPVGLHPRRRSERGDAPLDLDPLRACAGPRTATRPLVVGAVVTVVGVALVTL